MNDEDLFVLEVGKLWEHRPRLTSWCAADASLEIALTTTSF